MEPIGWPPPEDNDALNACTIRPDGRIEISFTSGREVVLKPDVAVDAGFNPNAGPLVLIMLLGQQQAEIQKLTARLNSLELITNRLRPLGGTF